MHKVCNIRDVALRASLPRKEMWAAYVRDLETLMDRAFEGGFASINTVSNDVRREAA